MNNATIPYVTRNLRHLLAAPNLTETQRTIITRTLATLSEYSAEGKRTSPESIVTTDDALFEIERRVRETVAIPRNYIEGGR